MIFSKKSLMTITILAVAIWVIPAISDDNVKELCIDILKTFCKFKNNYEDWGGTFISKTDDIGWFGWSGYKTVDFVNYYFMIEKHQKFLTSVTKRYIKELSSPAGGSISMNKLRNQISKLQNEIKVWEHLQTEINNLDVAIEKEIDDLEVAIEKENGDLEVAIEKVNGDEKFDIEKEIDDLEVAIEKEIDDLEVAIEKENGDLEVAIEKEIKALTSKWTAAIKHKLTSKWAATIKRNNNVKFQKQINAAIKHIQKQINDLDVAKFTLNLMLSYYMEERNAGNRNSEEGVFIEGMFNEGGIKWIFKEGMLLVGIFKEGNSEEGDSEEGDSEERDSEERDSEERDSEEGGFKWNIRELLKLHLNDRLFIKGNLLLASQYIPLVLKNFAFKYMKYLQTISPKTDKVNPIQNFCKNEIDAKYDNIIKFWKNFYFNFDVDLQNEKTMNSNINSTIKA